MKWLDIEDIAEALEQKHPNIDVLSLRFTLLRKMVLELEGFEDSETKCNEKILEAVQAEWLSLRH